MTRGGGLRAADERERRCGTIEPLRVAVIGAGIGGLALAAALRRAGGVRCEVYEQAHRLSEVGAGLQLAPNAVRLLHRLGLADRLRAVAVRPAATEIRRWDDGRLLSRTELGAACEAVYGAPYYTVHRAHLHEALLEAAGRDTVRLGRRLTGVRQHEGGVLLHFDGGEPRTADVVVGADGIRSAVRGCLVRDAPVWSGQTVYRGLVPGEALPELVRDPRVRVWMGPGQHCVCYPVSAGRAVSFAATVRPGASGDRPPESWSATGDPADLVRAYRGWDTTVEELLGVAGTVGVRRWALHDREPLRRWSAGRLTLLGDAAHPMLPFLAQGANQAVEDALCLAACLSGADAGSAPEALRRYEALRVPRTGAIQRGSRGSARVMHLDDGEEQRRRDGAMEAATALRAMAWLYGYDAERAALRPAGA